MILAASFRRQAFREYTAARRWYEKQRLGLGAKFEREIDNALLRACSAPNQFPEVVPKVRRTRAQRFPFVIYFRVHGEKLIVLAVFHARRDPAVWRKRT